MCCATSDVRYGPIADVPTSIRTDQLVEISCDQFADFPPSTAFVKQVGEPGPLQRDGVNGSLFVGAHAAEKDASVFAIHANSFADLPKATYSTKVEQARADHSNVVQFCPTTFREY
jgi:hypothetical protein